MATRTLKWGAVVIAAFGLVLGACGDDDDADDTADDTTEVTEPTGTTEGDDADDGGTDEASNVAIVDFAFSPADLTVAPGDEVTVSNRDSAPHTYTSDDGGFDTGSLAADSGEGSITAPSEPGSYDVICTIHPTITGTLTVEG